VDAAILTINAVQNGSGAVMKEVIEEAMEEVGTQDW